jgi:hypothetical protein
MRRWSQMSLAEILAALEGMQMIANRLSRAPKVEPDKAV